MNEEVDLEDVLKRYRGGPSPHVKRSVMSRFLGKFGGGAKGRAGLWRKPVPLYVAAASVVIAVGLSFFAGQRISRPERRAGILREYYQEVDSTDQELKWEVAASDLL